MTIKMTGTSDEIADFFRNLAEHPLEEITVDLSEEYEEDFDRKEEYYD